MTVALLFVGTGCSEPPRPEPSLSASARYDLQGKVVSVDRSAKQLTVDHDAIPGFMGAMTMAYAVKDERALETVSPGDEIMAKVVSGDGSYWLAEIAVTKSRGSSATSK